MLGKSRHRVGALGTTNAQRGGSGAGDVSVFAKGLWLNTGTVRGDLPKSGQCLHTVKLAVEG